MRSIFSKVFENIKIQFFKYSEELIFNININNYILPFILCVWNIEYILCTYIEYIQCKGHVVIKGMSLKLWIIKSF